MQKFFFINEGYVWFLENLRKNTRKKNKERKWKKNKIKINKLFLYIFSNSFPSLSFRLYLALGKFEETIYEKKMKENKK